MKIKCVLFSIEDVLYDSTFHMSTARLNAVRAMIEDGLPTDVETTYRVLEEIVNEYGSDYTKHFDELLTRLGLKWNPRVIASGVIAYRETSAAYLKPYPDTVPILLSLRDKGYRIAVVSAGRAVKQWQKLVQLGLEHIFHFVVISEELSMDQIEPRIFKETLNRLGIKSQETIFIGNRFEPDIAGANKAGVTSVLIRKSKIPAENPKTVDAKPKFEIGNLSEIFEVINKIEAMRK